MCTTPLNFPLSIILSKPAASFPVWVWPYIHMYVYTHHASLYNIWTGSVEPAHLISVELCQWRFVCLLLTCSLRNVKNALILNDARFYSKILCGLDTSVNSFPTSEQTGVCVCVCVCVHCTCMHLFSFLLWGHHPRPAVTWCHSFFPCCKHLIIHLVWYADTNAG